MTAVTIQFEDKLLGRLKQNADRRGYSLDNYILYVLTQITKESSENTSLSDIDMLLDSMQLHGIDIPVTEDGKGAVASCKYM